VSLPLLTAVTPQYESGLTAKLGTSGSVHVVRRCADLAELLGAVAAGIGRVAVVSADLRGLDGAAIRELVDRGVLVLGVHRPGDEAGERMLRRWAVAVVVPADVDQPTLDAALTELVSTADEPRLPSAREPRVDAAAATDGGPGERPSGPHGTAAEVDGEAPTPAGAPERGKVVVVWGPVGSPGRTTVAVNVAAELAEVDTPVMLVDLDTYGASVAQVLAVLDEAPGVAAAARAADQGTLARAALLRLAPEVAPGLRVLTGLPRPDRWPELREHAVQDVLAECADLVPLTVVDIGFCLEADEELSFDTTAPRRNGAALAALEAADEVVVVGSADPVALQRLVRGLDQLAEVTDVPTTVTVNRVRAGAVGKDPGRRVREALRRFAGVEDVVLVTEDRASIDAAVLEGRTLREARPGSPARTGLRELAARVGGHPLAPAGRRAGTRRAARV